MQPEIVIDGHATIGAGAPDGMTIDVDGCLWVALYGGSAVHRYTPDGRLDASVTFPVTNITCPIFGGPGFDALYVTSAADGGAPAAGECAGLVADFDEVPQRL